MNRVMFAIPFAVLIATYGVLAMWNSQARAIRVVAAALVASIVVQFVGFHRDYMSDGYRTTAATWFSGNSREALRELLARSGNGEVYISRDIEWVHRFWRFLRD
jgi:alkylated DNA nucleotide flippase Atl1